MSKFLENLTFHPDTIGAIFIIFLTSLLVLSNLAIGFILPLYIVVLSVGFILSIFYPLSGFYAIIFVTIIFERFFTLQHLIIGRLELKLYPLDIIFIGVILGTLIHVTHNKIKIKLKALDYSIIIFIFITFLYFLASLMDNTTVIELSFSSFKNYSFYSLFYFVTFLLLKENFNRFIKFFLVGTIGLIFFVLFGLFTGKGLWTEITPLSTEGTRILGFYHAFYLSLSFLGLLVYLVINNSGKKKTKIPLADYPLAYRNHRLSYATSLDWTAFCCYFIKPDLFYGTKKETFQDGFWLWNLSYI